MSINIDMGVNVSMATWEYKKMDKEEQMIYQHSYIYGGAGGERVHTP